MKNIRIAYVNVNGLTWDKWKILLGYVKEYDLVFAAETWYIDQEQHLHFPLTLASTYPSKVYPGRQHHGLLCLCSPSSVIQSLVFILLLAFLVPASLLLLLDGLPQV